MKIILACGGTGGHIFPAFSVAEELKSRFAGIEIIYVCGKKDIENEIFKIVTWERVVPIESAPARMALSLSGVGFLIKLTRGFFRASALLRSEKPALVVGFGGHYSFPVVLAAKCLGIKTLIHEQNAKPGMANKFLIRFVDAVALSYPETGNYLKPHSNVRVTGNPIRASIESASRSKALKFFDFQPNKRTLLVLGGSQGAESINSLFLGALKFFPESLKARVQVLHLCGKMAPGEVENLFKEFGIEGRAYSFFDRMDLAYALTDVALGRAGATFLAEAACKNIPVILIPYPFGDGHQRENAKIYGRERSAVILEQSDLDPERLAKILIEQINKDEKIMNIPLRLSASVNARALLSDFIVDIANLNEQS